MTDFQKEDRTDNASAASPFEVTVSVPPDAGPAVSEKPARQIKIFCYKCQQKLDVTGLMPFAHVSCPSCGTDLIIPKWFDNYLLEEPCGRGGMASVYRALDVTLDREVAVKILDRSAIGDGKEAFLNEARTAATINHSAVIPIYTCGIFEDQAYIVMQFMNGGSLEQKLQLKKGTPLPLDEVMQWIHDAAEGLEYASRHGIIHHDVKPGNIMLDADGNAKIGDFGIARRNQSGENPDQDFYGSPLYISPEKVSTGKEESSGDIYSLGATFYHLLTGIPPFQHENLEDLLWSRVKQNPMAPHKLRPGISPLISSLVMRMMHHDPELRPGYEEIIRNLNAVLHNSIDSSTLMMSREMPLPKNQDGGKSPNSTSSLRVKSPSVAMKRRRSSIIKALPPEADGDPAVKELGTAVKKSPDSPEAAGETEIRRKNRWLPVLIILSAITAGFMIFSVIQLIRAADFSEETVRSVLPKK